MSVNWDADDTRQRTDLKIQRNQRPHGATPTPVLESKPPFRSSKTNRPQDVVILAELGLLERTASGGVLCPYSSMHIDMYLKAA